MRIEEGQPHQQRAVAKLRSVLQGQGWMICRQQLSNRRTGGHWWHRRVICPLATKLPLGQPCNAPQRA